MLDNQPHAGINVSIVVAHPHALFREAVAEVLSDVRDFVVEAVGDLPELEARISAGGRVDVVLLDTAIAATPTITTVQRTAQMNRGGAVIALGCPDDIVMVPMLLEAGARGVISKTMSMRSVPNAIRLVHSGEIFVPADLHRARAAAPANEDLSSLEMAVLRRIGEGQKNKEIAWELHLTDVAVKMHVRNICRKVGAKNRTHAVVIARQRGLV